MKTILTIIFVGIFSLNANATDFTKKAVEEGDTKVVHFENDTKLIQLKAERDEVQSFLGDCEEGGLPDKCCPYWSLDVEDNYMDTPVIPGKFELFNFPTFKCTTGGSDKCPIDSNCSDEN